MGPLQKYFEILSKFPARIHLMTFYKAHQQLKTAVLKTKHYNGRVQRYCNLIPDMLFDSRRTFFASHKETAIFL